MILIALLAALLLPDAVQGAVEASLLYRDLMDSYADWNPDHVLLPVHNTSETQKASFGLSLVSFPEYDVAIKVATFHTWHTLEWTDPYLSWDPAEYGDIRTLRVPIARIWRPDIVLFNEFLPSEKFEDVLAVVSSDGSVKYIPRLNHKILCTENSTNLSCRLKFGSWTFDGFRLDLGFYGDNEGVDVNNYVPSNDYELVGHPAERHVKYYPCCVEPYIDLTFNLEFAKTSSGSTRSGGKNGKTIIFAALCLQLHAMFS